MANDLAGLGHNNGPTLEAGTTWRTHAWKKARTQLLPKLPIEVVRLRVKRAQALGLPYKTYAGIRASSGHDLVGFLFSHNALGVMRAGQNAPQTVTDKLDALTDCSRIGITHPQIDLSSLTCLDHITTAPAHHIAWSDMRDRMKQIARETGYPPDRFVLVGETGFERDWAEAMQAAGFLRGQAYFTPTP